MRSPIHHDGPLVLLVEDDDPAVPGFLTRALIGSGFRVATADRLATAPSAGFAIVVLDAGPTVAGLSRILSEVRSRWAQIPVLVLLASAEAEVWNVISEARATVLVKPFRPGELVNAVRRLVLSQDGDLYAAPV
jgi:DNA-binding response OmpR family regulator